MSAEQPIHAARASCLGGKRSLLTGYLHPVKFMMLPAPPMREEMSMELSKILAKTMQSSYKKKEVRESVERIMEKAEVLLQSQNDEAKIRELRLEFEDIRRRFYGL